MGEGKGGERGKEEKGERRRKGRGRNELGEVKGRRRREEEGKRGGRGVEGVGK